MRRRHLSPPKTGPRNDLNTIRTLLPYLWPRNLFEFKVRVVVAVALLVAAKAINVAVPLFYKHAVDALTPGTAAVLAVPVALLVAYGLARILSLA